MADTSLPSVLPEGWTVIPLRAADETATLRLGPLHHPPKERGSPFVILRTLAEATVYLAALADSKNRVHLWLEMWIPRSSEDHPPTPWETWRTALETIDPARFLAAEPGSAVSAALQERGFPLSTADSVVFRRYAPLDFTQFGQVISRAVWRGSVLESDLLHALCPAASAAEDLVRFGDGFYLLSRRGSAGLFAESLFLKLNLFYQALTLCEKATADLQRPFLNLSPRSFGVELADTAGLLPAAWTAALSLRDPGARLLPFLTLDDAVYLSLDGPTTQSIYQSRRVRPPVSGSGTVRLRKVQWQGEDLSLEGTLASTEPLGDEGLVELPLELPSGRLILRACLTPGGGQGESRFRSRLRPSPGQAAELSDPDRLAPFQDIAFTLRPPLSSACDLYSLAVIGMELFLVDGQQSLSVVLDEMLSLGDFLQSLPVSDEIPLHIERAVAEQASGNWSRALGPQRLIQDADGRPFPYEEALGYVPSEIWWRTVYLLLRMLTNGWHFNYCKHLNDAPSLAPHTVYRQPRAQIEATLDQARSLILLDWDLNQEVRSLIEGRLNHDAR